MKTQSKLGVLCVLLFVSVACSKQPTGQVKGPWISAQDIPAGETKPVQLSNGAEILLQNIGGVLYYSVEGTYTDEEFTLLLSNLASKPAAEKTALLNKSFESMFNNVRKNHGIGLTHVNEVGYFTFMLPYVAEIQAQLFSLGLAKGVLVQPIIYDNSALASVKAFTPRALGIEEAPGPRDTTDPYSGLRRIHADVFSKEAEKDILDQPEKKVEGPVSVDGSQVKIGITDTGLTLNHPTFLSKKDKSKNRIFYLKDFTKEGRVYFNPKAKFEVSSPATTGDTGGGEEDLLVNAEVLLTPKLPTMPLGDRLVQVNGLKIKVSPELKVLLTNPASKAKLGVLSESAFQSDAEAVDINANGSQDDNLFMILVPGATPEDDVVYLDKTGTGDFRNSKPLGNWNKTHSEISVKNEKIGFDLKSDELPKQDGSGTVTVRSASVVGFDPGNHGSHVAGIAAGSKTISNDPDDTLARGVAPEAEILLNRVCANNGGCNAAAAFIDLVVKGGAEVVNMSLGGLNPYNDGYGVEEVMINRLITLYNVMFVISAGNSGPGRQTVGSPSVARLSLSVGASASRELIQRQYGWPGLGASEIPDEDFVLFFSSRGPTAAGGFKPNLVAPGTELSSIQLNSAQGARAGLDVYWGTSMAAPTATGAYALFLDAVKKYNDFHPSKKLPTDSRVLRQILISSARFLDENNYTWIDEGNGILDLPSAWKLLFQYRDQNPPTAVTSNNEPVELDYKVLVQATGPNGIAYDGSRIGDLENPAFGSGLYLDYRGTETLRKVHFSRLLPEKWTSSQANSTELLERQLLTSRDEFVLKTVYYGSGASKPWLKVGALDRLNCSESETARLSIISKGVIISMNPDGTGTLGTDQDSLLNVCLDRDIISNELAPGDQGALILAYRAVGEKISPLPSFVVPVFLTVPHKTLSQATAYEVDREVNSFGVSRNYVEVPRGTSVVRLTLEVPELKLGSNCSGVELMALEGSNTANPIKARKDARVSNCKADGTPILDSSKRGLVYTKMNPVPGTWDIHVFGQYRYAKSKYKLRIDYVTGTTNIEKIAGPLASLTGSLTWTLQDASLAVKPSGEKSTFMIDSLFNSVAAVVEKDAQVVVENPLGKLRVYPKEAKSVTITTGGSPGNDIDLNVVECPSDATDVTDPKCGSIGQSGGSTDEEKVTFQPKTGKTYAAIVYGYSIKDEGIFSSGEKIAFKSEKGLVTTSGAEPSYTVNYTFSPEQLEKSVLLKSDLFLTGKYSVTGSLALRSNDYMTLKAVPVEISGKN